MTITSKIIQRPWNFFSKSNTVVVHGRGIYYSLWIAVVLDMKTMLLCFERSKLIILNIIVSIPKFTVNIINRINNIKAKFTFIPTIFSSINYSYTKDGL